MNRDVFEQRWAGLNPHQESKARALVEEYRKDLTEVHRAALRYLPAGGENALRVASLLAKLEETAVDTLAKAVAEQKPVPDTALLVDLADGFALAESAVTNRLRSALTDTRMVPVPPDMAGVEELEPPYRVCDEAYIALRRILNPESSLQNEMESRHFLPLPDADKTREIQFFLQTGAFTRYLEDVDVEDE